MIINSSGISSSKQFLLFLFHPPFSLFFHLITPLPSLRVHFSKSTIFMEIITIKDKKYSLNARLMLLLILKWKFVFLPLYSLSLPLPFDQLPLLPLLPSLPWLSFAFSLCFFCFPISILFFSRSVFRQTILLGISQVISPCFDFHSFSLFLFPLCKLCLFPFSLSSFLFPL